MNNDSKAMSNQRRIEFRKAHKAGKEWLTSTHYLVLKNADKLDGSQAQKWQRLEPYGKFVQLVESHWHSIAPYCHPDNKVSFGLVEGVNNKIRVLQRRAYGYRDEEYLKQKNDSF